MMLLISLSAGVSSRLIDPFMRTDVNNLNRTDSPKTILITDKASSTLDAPSGSKLDADMRIYMSYVYKEYV